MPADKSDNSIFIPPAAIWIVDNTENKHATRFLGTQQESKQEGDFFSFCIKS